MDSLCKSNTSFCLDLFKKLCDDDKTANVFFSPFSISSALSMVMLGARGNTATQMSKVLCFTEAQNPQQQMMQMQQQVQSTLPPVLLKECQDEVHTSFCQLLKELNKPGASYALRVANRLYGEKTCQFVDEFLGHTKKHYDAELNTVNFQTDAENARVTINSWVESKTQGKIKDLLVQGVVNSMTKLVLVNAIYFKGNWNQKFKESQTRVNPFRINRNETKMVKMMQQESTFPWAHIRETNLQILEMPYIGKELSMLIFLPDDIKDGTTGLDKLEKELNFERFVDWTKRMREREINVLVPKFKLEESYDLKNVLMSMGMVDAFEMGMCDFSGMSPVKGLALSKVVHKAFVEVNEEGTEAAAATAPVIMLMCARMTPTFNADHPFLFFIRHNASGSILFAGRYCSPE